MSPAKAATKRCQWFIPLLMGFGCAHRLPTSVVSCSCSRKRAIGRLGMVAKAGHQLSFELLVASRE